MTNPAITKRRGRPASAIEALSPVDGLKLVSELRHGVAPVNFAALIREFKVSRGTILRYIKDEGLSEVIEARRAEKGRGYVPVTRGTRATRKVAKQKREETQTGPGTHPLSPTALKMWERLWSQQVGAWDAMTLDKDDEPEPYIAQHLAHARAAHQAYATAKAGITEAEILASLPPAPARKQFAGTTHEDWQEKYRRETGTKVPKWAENPLSPDAWKEREMMRGKPIPIKKAIPKPSPDSSTIKPSS